MPKSVQCGHSPGGAHPPNLLLVAHGPELIVDIGFDPNYSGSGKPAGLGALGLPALIDTGAYASFIDADLAALLKLPAVDQQTVSGSAGQHAVTMYLGHIYVPALDVTINGQFGGVQLSAGGQRHRALIGRSFLMHFKMTYDGITGQVELLKP
jgi:hypothetical protein